VARPSRKGDFSQAKKPAPRHGDWISHSGISPDRNSRQYRDTLRHSALARRCRSRFSRFVMTTGTRWSTGSGFFIRLAMTLLLSCDVLRVKLIEQCAPHLGSPAAPGWPGSAAGYQQVANQLYPARPLRAWVHL